MTETLMARKDELDAHASRNDNPHGVTAEQVGAEAPGASAAVQDNLDTHTADTANPHVVTKAQVGLGNVLNVAQLVHADIGVTVLALNGDGSGLTAITASQISGLDELIPEVSTAMEPVLASATLPLARAAFGLGIGSDVHPYDPDLLDIGSAIQNLRDQQALTNLRLLLNTAISSGTLVAGEQWELMTDEWGATSTGEAYFSATPSYYRNMTKVAYAATGADQTFDVPAGGTEISWKGWGAGGGMALSATESAGAGGYATDTISVTPGETLTVIVGKAGTGTPDTGSNTGVASGGGRSAIRRGSTELGTAGGGGGAVSAVSASGGAGGGAEGAAGGGAAPGGGGTQSAGGALGGIYGTAGSQFQGGTGGDVGWTNTVCNSPYGGGGDGRSDGSTASGGGGGGGYYGGGGASNHASGGGGGGGSSYVPAGSTTAGSGANAPNTGDEDYEAGVADGAAEAGGAGGDGLIVISAAATATLEVPSAVSLSESPDFADMYFLWKDESASAVLGTDITVNLSRDGGANVVAATLTNIGDFDGSYSIIRARADLSAQPSGTSLWAEIILGTKLQRVAAPALYAE